MADPSLDPLDRSVTDRIEIRGLELLVFCGVLPEEQARRQPFRFDIDLEVDLAPAGQSDALDDTVDYGAICAELTELLEAGRFQLLEAMTARMAEAVLAHGLVDAVTINAKKLRPPIPGHVATTGVRIRRTR